MRQLSLLEAGDRYEEIRRLTGPEWWDRYEQLPEADRPEDCRAAPCPKCGARIGVRCRRPSGHSGPAIGAHADRWNLVLAEAEARNREELNTN
jgi:hypothetical protein